MILGSASLILGYLIVRNQEFQAAQWSQYRRFATIYAAQQSMSNYRNRGNQLNSATLARDRTQQERAAAGFEAARTSLDAQLDLLADFNAPNVAIIRDALSEVPIYRQRLLDAIFSGNQVEVTLNTSALQQRLDLFENTLHAISEREQAKAEEIQGQEERRTASAIRLAVGVIVGTGVAAVFLTLLVIRSIIRPLQLTTNAIRQVNLGEIEIDLPPVTNDEFGDMAVALRQFRDQAERLRRLAYQDPLTGLGNRARLEESLQRAIERARQTRRPIALFFVDLDNFRAVNDKFGHKAGDRYLCEATSRLHRFMPYDAFLCRYGGDKFTIMVENLDSGQALEPQLREQADCVLRGLAETYPFGDHLLNMSVSIGIAVFPGDGETAEQIISSADAAMYVAKKHGRNNARFASAQLTGNMRRQLAVASDIRRGLESGEFEPFYQPVIDVERGKVVGAEALLRWRHPENGLLLPSEFIQVAEESGLINQLGELCLIRAHEQALEWAARNRRVRIAVNLSVRQVHDGKILQILRGLRAPDIAPNERLIEFELTESALLDTTEYSQKVLSEIKKLGFRMGLDDFGTGYSSFSYLQRLPIDKIKIDRLFVTSMGISKQALAIVSATLTLAQNLDLGVVAEGVETVEQMRQLKILGCKLQQGFFFTRALPASDFEAWATAFEQNGMAALTANSAASRETPVSLTKP
ncbi:MAG: hypothetical protein NVS9B10_07230 [Nevskia sp.]